MNNGKLLAFEDDSDTEQRSSKHTAILGDPYSDLSVDERLDAELQVRISVRVCLCVCMHVCMYVCMYAFVYVCKDLNMLAQIFA